MKEHDIMGKYTREDILLIAKEEDVEFIRLQFTDMFGTMKNIAIPFGKLEKAMNNQCTIGSLSTKGFYEDEEELYLHPDLDTFCILSWRPQRGKVARFICDLYKADGTPYQGSPRYILQETIDKVKAKGYTFMVKTECEFFLFHTDDNGNPTTLTHEQAGYMDLSPVDLGENTRRDIILALEEMEYEVESSHHEIAPGQHEIDFAMADVMENADKLMTFKFAVRTIAKRNGLHATFMPKPKEDVNGSGMHINMVLYKDGKNVFADTSDELGLSREAYAFIAGILKHIKGMTAILNPIVNSYKRLVPGFEAPSEITWSAKQLTALIKVPSVNQKNKVIELRSPDPSANPYLVFATCLAAGIEGIEQNLEVPPELTKSISNMASSERSKVGIESLPENLNDALSEMGNDEFIKAILGVPFFEHYKRTKQNEWKSYMKQVSRWEIEQYLYKL